MSLTKEDILKTLTTNQTDSLEKMEEIAELILQGGSPELIGTFTFADFQPEAGNLKTIVLGNEILKAGSSLTLLYIDLKQAFVGPGVTSALLNFLDIAGNVYIIGLDVFAVITNNSGAQFTGSLNAQVLSNKVLDADLQCQLALGGGEVIDNLIEGEFDAYKIVQQVL